MKYIPAFGIIYVGYKDIQLGSFFSWLIFFIWHTFAILAIVLATINLLK